MEVPDTRYVAVGKADVAYQVVGDGPFDLLYCFGLGGHIEGTWEIPRNAEFYTEVLGFVDRTQQVNPGQAGGAHPTMSFLVAGSQGLDLFEVSDTEAIRGQRMNHMGLSVEQEDLPAVIALLDKAGIEVSEPTPRNTVFISDPDGNHIEILPGQARVRQL